MQLFEVDYQLSLVNIPHLFAVNFVKDILNGKLDTLCLNAKHYYPQVLTVTHL